MISEFESISRHNEGTFIVKRRAREVYRRFVEGSF